MEGVEGGGGGGVGMGGFRERERGREEGGKEQVVGRQARARHL